MITILLGVVGFGLALLLLGLGLLLGARPIEGSCGGLNRIPGVESDCGGACRASCRRRRERAAPGGAGT